MPYPLTPFPLKYVRQQAEPVDVDMVMTEAERTAYLSNPLRYAGQIVGDPSASGEAFILNATRNGWIPLGSTEASGGWSPVFAIKTLDETRVLKVVDWIGGTGDKPDVDVYVGPDDFVINPEDAVDIRGLQGPGGDDGADGIGVTDVSLISTVGLVKTYRFTFTDGSFYDYAISDGVAGTAGAAGRSVSSIARTSGTGAAGTTDTYTITYSDATTSTYSVVNGANGTNGATADMTRSSTTSLTIGTGSKVFTFTASSSNLGWNVGTRLRAASSASPTNWMGGIVTAVSTSSVTIDVDTIGGSGTIASWNISVAGQPGVSGSAFIVITTPGATANTLTITPVSSTELAPNYEITLTSTSGSTNTVPHAFQLAFASTLPNGASGLLRVLNSDTTNIKVLTIPAGDKLLNGSVVSQTTVNCQPASRYTEIAFKKSSAITLWYYVD